LLILLAVPGMLPAQTAEVLQAAPQAGQDVVLFGLGYDLQRFSPLKQINTHTIGRLVPVWSMPTGNNLGEEAQPLVWNGVMYFNSLKTTYALDAVTGQLLWRKDFDFGPAAARVACCGQSNRGAALFNGVLYRATFDNHIVALNAKTGAQIWQAESEDFQKGYSMSGAPLIANGVVIVGVAGGEYGVRGYLEGYDALDGHRLWKRYTVPAPGEPGIDSWPGDTWQHGGGATWLTGSYDAQMDLVYWGTGNPGPWNANVRKGDNLYTDSVLAFRPKTGEVVWHYQFTPNDAFDFDGTNELVLAELPVAGVRRKIVMQANRNGYFYVLDRSNGELLAANAFVPVTWAERIDLKSGRPVETDAMKHMRETGEKIVGASPTAFGAKNWSPMSFNADTGLVYLNALNSVWDYKPVKPEFRQGAEYYGVDSDWKFDPKEGGTLKALDPVSGKIRWQHGWPIASFSGTLTTAGDLVFSGDMIGEFHAFDARSGKELWSFRTGSGIISQPIAWQKDGREYITLASGIGGVYPAAAGDERIATVPVGGALWTFALMR
jgi:alcohol dehydrogenase (cytochrome c)